MRHLGAFLSNWIPNYIHKNVLLPITTRIWASLDAKLQFCPCQFSSLNPVQSQLWAPVTHWQSWQLRMTIAKPEFAWPVTLGWFLSSFVLPLASRLFITGDLLLAVNSFLAPVGFLSFKKFSLRCILSWLRGRSPRWEITGAFTSNYRRLRVWSRN